MGKLVRFTVKSLEDLKNSLRIGQKVEISVVLADTAPRRTKVQGIIVMKYPFNCTVRYQHRGKLREENVKYVDLLVGWPEEEAENK